MCHISPTAQMLGLMITIMSALYISWHIWCFDRGRCLLFSRKNIFRWTILMMLVVSLICFTMWSGMMCWVKYHEYYAVVPGHDGMTMIRPVPFQLWSEERQDLVRASYHVMSVGWGLLVSVHAEETLYWAYLIGSIRDRGSESWFSSRYFKIWLGCVATAMSVQIGVACIETKDLNEMEHYIFFAGALLGLIVFCASLWLLVAFPRFIAQSRRQGANSEVLGRLQYFKELNAARTVFRFFYALCLLTLATDAWTEHRYVNASPFWTDVLFTMAYFSALTSTTIAVMILLPRSMTEEAGGAQTAQVYVNRPTPFQQTYRKTSLPIHSDSATSDADSVQHRSAEPANFVNFSDANHRDTLGTPWDALGERLNIDKNALGDFREHGRGAGEEESEMYHVPFAAQPGSRRLAEGEEVHHLPRQLNDFRSPLDAPEPRRPVDLNIVVVSETVVEKH